MLYIMNETEKKDYLSEIFFQEEARRICESFGNTSNGEGHLHYLHRKLNYMKEMHTRLELPWVQYIPILYKSLALYMHTYDGTVNFTRTMQQTAQLMECITFLSQSGRQFAMAADFYDKQIKEIEQEMRKARKENIPQV